MQFRYPETKTLDSDHKAFQVPGNFSERGRERGEHVPRTVGGANIALVGSKWGESDQRWASNNKAFASASGGKFQELRVREWTYKVPRR